MINGLKGMFVGSALMLSAACAGYPLDSGTGQSISIPYDPYDFSPDDLQAEADNHCGAYNMRAVYDGETANPQEVRWRYRHYRCV